MTLRELRSPHRARTESQMNHAIVDFAVAGERRRAQDAVRDERCGDKGSTTAPGSCHVRSPMTNVGVSGDRVLRLASRLRDQVEVVQEVVDNVLDAIRKDISLLASSAASDEGNGTLQGAERFSKAEGYPEGNRAREVDSHASTEITHRGAHPRHQRGTGRDCQENSCGGKTSKCEPKIPKLVKQDGRGGSSNECEMKFPIRRKEAWRSIENPELESAAPKGLEQDGRVGRSCDCESDAPKLFGRRSSDCGSTASKRFEKDVPLGVWQLEEQLCQQLIQDHPSRPMSRTSTLCRSAKTPIQPWVVNVNQAASPNLESSSQVRSQDLHSVHHSPPVLKSDGPLPDADAGVADAEEGQDEVLPGNISDHSVRRAVSEPPSTAKNCSKGIRALCESRDPKVALNLLPHAQQPAHEGAPSTSTIDSMFGRPEGNWCQRFAILPLVVCGLYPPDIDHTRTPPERKRQWHAMAHQSFVMVIVFACLVAHVWQLSGKGEPAGAEVVKPGRLSEIAIALGSLIGICSVHAIFCGPDINQAVGVLRFYTGEQEGGDVWSKRSCVDLIVTLFFWAGSVLLRVCTDGSMAGAIEGNMDAHEFRGTLAFIVVSGIALSLAGIILHVNRAMVVLIDGFCATSMACTDIDWQAAAQAWNRIHSVIRHTCRMVQVCFVILQVTVFASVVCISVELWSSKQTLLETLMAVAPTFTLCAGLTRTLFSSVDVTNRCDRLPALVSSAQSKVIIDAAHNYFLTYLSSCAAGFYMFGARLTSVIALKFLYVLSALGFAALSRLAD